MCGITSCVSASPYGPLFAEFTWYGSPYGPAPSSRICTKRSSERIPRLDEYRVPKPPTRTISGYVFSGSFSKFAGSTTATR